MTASSKRWALALLPAALLAAHPAYSEERQAWHIEAKGFANPRSTDAVIGVDNGKYWLSPADMESLGFDLSKMPTINGRIDLSTGGTLSVNELEQTITVQVRPEMLPENVFDFRTGFEYMAPASATSGAYLNYDIRGTSDTQNDISTSSVTGLFDFNTFLFDSVRANVQTIIRTGEIGAQRRAERVSASISRDNAASSLSWSVGDAQSAGGHDVNPVSFTGVQIKKNFTLQPGFVSQPTYDLKGSAASPSVVDVFIDNRKVMSGAIPSGPFSLRNLTAMSGSSNARIVVRDIFGQEQIITQPLFGGPQLLKKGLSSYAAQAGTMRSGYSENDGQFASAYYRYGFADFLTAEVNAEKSTGGVKLADVNHTGATVAVSTLVGDFGLSARAGTGHIRTSSYQNTVSGSGWTGTLNANFTRSSPDYNVLGSPTASNQTRRTLQASVQTDIGLSASVFDIQTPSSASTGLTFNYSPRRAYATSYSLTLNKNRFGAGDPFAIYLTANIPFDSVSFDRIRSSSVRFNRESNGLFSPAIDYSDSPQNSFGNSYRLHQEGLPNSLRLDADFNRRSFSSEYGFSASRTPNGVGYRSFIRGAVIQHNGTTGTSRWIDGGYAVVDAGGPDIKVNVSGQSQGKSNSDGIAYVPITMPFTKVSINLDSETVPDNYDNNPVVVSVYRGGGAKAVFRGILATMVRVPGITEGHVMLDGKAYPITDRGFFVELPEGSYTGMTDKQKKVRFTVPKSSKAGLTYVQGTLE